MAFWVSPWLTKFLPPHRGSTPGTASDVKPWQFLSGIAKDAARAWFVQRAEDRGIAWRCRGLGLGKARTKGKVR